MRIVLCALANPLCVSVYLGTNSSADFIVILYSPSFAIEQKAGLDLLKRSDISV